MSNKYNDLDKCTTGREFGQFARNHEDDGYRVEKNGSYLCVQNDKGDRVYVPDSDRALPKPSRQLILNAFKLIGLAGLVGLLAYFLG